MQERQKNYLERALDVYRGAAAYARKAAAATALIVPLAIIPSNALSGEERPADTDSLNTYPRHEFIPPPPANTIRVRGTLADALTLSGVPSAKVRIAYQESGTVDSVLTDSRGRYSIEFPAAPASNHTFVVAAEKPGWYSYRDTLFDSFPAASVKAENPMSFTVHQNRPNPFSLYTQITVDVEKQTPLECRIYSITGSLVRDFSIDAVPGRYAIDWGRDDKKGWQVSPGIYLARVSTPEKSQTIKLSVLDAPRSRGGSRIYPLHVSPSAAARREQAMSNRAASTNPGKDIIDKLYTFERYTDPDNAGSTDSRKDLLEWIRYIHGAVNYQMPDILWIHRWRDGDISICDYLNTAQSPPPSAQALEITRDALATIGLQLGRDLFQEVASLPSVGIKTKYGPGPSNAAITQWALDGNNVPLYPLKGEVGLTIDSGGNPQFDKGDAMHENGHILFTTGQHSPFPSHLMGTSSSRQDFSDFEARALKILYSLPNTSEKRYLIH